jgi:undecaprenyl-diphosphatase
MTDRISVAGSVTIAVGIVGLLLLGHAVMAGHTRSFDEWAVHSLRNGVDPSLSRGPAWLQGAVRDLTGLGSIAVVTLFSLGAVGYALLARHRRLSVLIFSAAAGAFLLNTGLKILYGRPRPEYAQAAGILSRSYPSGHAMVSAAVYLSLGAVLAARQERRALKVYLLACASLLTILVGLSRVYLGYHYPSDVLAGWTAGIVWAVACGLATRATGEHS